MKKLPGDLEEFLPIIPDWIFYLLVIIGSLIFFYYFSRWLNKKMRPLLFAPPEKKISKGHNIDQFNGTIAKIKTKHIETKTFRAGCFDLSSAMRTFLEDKTAIEFEEMTAGDIREFLRSKAHINFFDQLETLQYGKSEPNLEQFNTIFSLATKAAKKGVKTK